MNQGRAHVYHVEKFVFRPSQLVVLQSSFESNGYPSREEREVLAKQCGLKLRQVNSWFGNQRNRDQPGWKGNEKGKHWKGFTCGYEGKTRPGVARPSRVARPSIAGSPAGNAPVMCQTRKLMPVPARLWGGHPVTFFRWHRGGQIFTFRTESACCSDILL